jgi:hypothetical protein
MTPAGTAATHEAVVAEAINSMRTTAASLNRVADPTSAERAIADVKRESQNLQSLRQQVTRLGKASASEKGRVQQHSQEMTGASQGMVQASSGVVKKIQAGQFSAYLAKRLASASEEYGQAMVDFGKQATPLFE